MLELLSIVSHYGKLQVLKDVSLKVKKGQLVSLVGAVAAGKSTMAKVILGVNRPTSGAVLLEGDHITELPTHEIVRRGIVLVPEGRRLFPDMTVLENLLVSSSTPESRPARQRNLAKVMEVFPPLEGKRKQLAKTLSGGEQQMVAIARALMSSPRLLIADEPSLGLAPLIVRNILGVIRRLKEQGLTVMLIEQNVHLSLSICDYGYVLENGCIVVQGTGKELLQDKKTREAYLG